MGINTIETELQRPKPRAVGALSKLPEEESGKQYEGQLYRWPSMLM